MCAQDSRWSKEGDAVPLPPTWYSEIFNAYTQLNQEFLDLYSRNKPLVFAIYGIGFGAGAWESVGGRFV